MVVSLREPQLFTEEEYLALEAVSRTKHELIHGHIVAMAGASPAHGSLVGRLTVILDGLVRRHGCVVRPTDQRVHVPATGLYTYPDVVVACGERQYKADNPPSLLNPNLLVEVTSASTESDDRGLKFDDYKSIASLGEYVVVSHRGRRIDHHRRLETGQWLSTTLSGDDGVVESAVLGGSFLVRDVYEGIDLEEGLPRGRPG